MPLPEFNRVGDLPEGLYQTTIDEVTARFSAGTAQRQRVTARLLRIYKLAKATGKLDRLVIFGSYVTNKPDPNDVDIVLIMHDDFNLKVCDVESRSLFEHTQAASEFGASVFWIRPSLLILESLDEFIKHWQLKRDRTRRGIVEVLT
jgi:predicted nucleotidyltransferase